jgi:hypothetical protein
MARYNTLLRGLEPRVQRQVASENAERLWFGGGDKKKEAGSKP